MKRIGRDLPHIALFRMFSRHWSWEESYVSYNYRVPAYRAQYRVAMALLRIHTYPVQSQG